MEYKPLTFQEYFIICSGNWNGKSTSQPIANYEQIRYEHKGHTHYANFQVRYDAARQCIQVILQQTADKTDWRANFEFPHKMYDKFTYDGKLIQLKCHRGWGDMWLACQDTIRRKVAALIADYDCHTIEVFGWSLGSGLAQLAAEDIYFKFGIKPYLYTYGSVKPFFGRATYNYVKGCCQEAYNFYDHCDIVGYMVPFIGWRAINHIKIKLDKFCITKLFKPQYYHTHYDEDYKEYENVRK